MEAIAEHSPLFSLGEAVGGPVCTAQGSGRLAESAAVETATDFKKEISVVHSAQGALGTGHKVQNWICLNSKKDGDGGLIACSKKLGPNWMSHGATFWQLAFKRPRRNVVLHPVQSDFRELPIYPANTSQFKQVEFDYTGLQGTHVEGVEPESSARALRRSKLPVSCYGLQNRVNPSWSACTLENPRVEAAE
jgi:hypothetical protein